MTADKKHKIKLPLLVFFLMLIASGLISSYFGDIALSKAILEELDEMSERLSYELAKYQNLPIVLAENTVFKDALLDDSKSNIDLSNKLLEKHALDSGTEAIYLLNKRGLAVSSSNWQSPSSFIGGSYHFRPYYKLAMQGRNTNYFALGTKSGKRGYYFSSPIRNGSELLGVVVVKVSLSTFEKYRPPRKGFEFILSDVNGIVFVSSQEQWNYKTLLPLEEKVVNDVAVQKQFGEGSIENLYIKGESTDLRAKKDISLVSNGARKPYRMQARFMEEEKWFLIVLAPSSLANRYHMHVLSAGTGLYLLGLFFGLYWRGTIESKQALQDLNDQLEMRVEARTSALLQTNQDLEVLITKYRYAQESLKQTQNELIHAEKLAVLGEMSAGINHELNQPLTAMGAYAENAKKFLDLGRDDCVSENLDAIVNLNLEMAKIIKKLKVFSRKSQYKLSSIPILPLLEDALVILNSQIRGLNVQVDIISETSTPQVMGDSTLLEQVFVNIINNAIYAASKAADPRVIVSVSSNKKSTKVLVSDNGKGVDEEILECIFEPFFTTKKAGLGLGLTLSKRIVESCNGSISVTNLPDNGAQFVIELLNHDIHPSRSN